MLNRRSFLGGLSASLPLLAMPGSLSAQGRAPRLHAMIVGINLYTGTDGLGRKVPDLKGAQNDAADIEQAVKRFKPATLVRLGWDGTAATDLAVTRADFLRTWEQTLAAAQSGDTLLLTYAGHGSRVQALPGNPSEEADGRDDTLVLTRWNANDGRHAEHIVDDELREMFEAAARKGVIVCFIADSCHSGTLTRSVDPLAGDKTYRYAREAPVTPRGPGPTPREAPAPRTTKPELPPNMVFFAGALETQVVPEICDSRTGRYHGALSLAFAQALADGAVNDGVITVRSLQLFVLQRARLLSEGAQSPRRRPTRVARVGEGVTDETPLFVLTAGTPRPPPTPPPGGHMVRLRIQGRSAADAERIVRSVRGAVLAGAGEAETLKWNAEQRLVLNIQGHRVAEKVGERELQGVVDCRAALDRLIQMTAGGLVVQVLIDGRDTPASDATHRPGDKLAVKISGLTDGDYLAVFNLTGTGLVQMLEPTPYHASNPRREDFTRPHFNTGVTVFGAERSLPDVHVGEPFGADHIVAVSGRRGLSRLMPVLKAANNQLGTADLITALVNESQAQGQTLKIGLRGIYTWRS